MQTGIGNAHDTYAVAVRSIIDGDIKTVRHVPRKFSALYVRFLLDEVHGSILCIVKGNR